MQRKLGRLVTEMAEKKSDLTVWTDIIEKKIASTSGLQMEDIRVFDTCSILKSLQAAEMRLFFVKFSLIICCVVLCFVL